ncbi:MAG: 1-deoxy-D-xylulose-5-phosphate reductoisomerase [Firmicutes bacterium]|nr:1-deoxy-D-xylulose-5-phosphate reductoisomerase [Bacillota bacterium]
MKRISILGSTGSIGTQALDIIKNNREELQVAALSCARRLDQLRDQIREFAPQAVCVAREEDAKRLQAEFTGTEVVWGMQGLVAIATMEGCDMVLNSLLGMQGLEPTLAAAKAGKDIAFANKETLVAGGELVMKTVRENGVALLPVDSEHSAIFQSLQGSGIYDEKGRPAEDPAANRIRRILLTASGGPFRGYTREQLEQVTLEQALKHPNWSMGAKITIDSASMMNKGLEVIEAKWLFDVPLEKIQIVVHPQSVLHSAVEFMDGSVIGQMGNPDMRVPIAYAFSYPKRLAMTGTMEPLDLFAYPGGLIFEPADDKVFRTIHLAYEASRRGGTYPVVLNGANEVLVAAFLDKKIRFAQIQQLLEEILDHHQPLHELDLETILAADQQARRAARELIEGR